MNDKNINDKFCMFRKSLSHDGKQLSWVINDGYPKIFNNIDDCLNAIMLDILNVILTKANGGTTKFWVDATKIYSNLISKIWDSYIYGDIKWEFCHISDVKHDDDKIHALLAATRNNLNILIDKYENLLTNTSKNGECVTIESINRAITEGISLLSELIK